MLMAALDTLLWWLLEWLQPESTVEVAAELPRCAAAAEGAKYQRKAHFEQGSLSTPQSTTLGVPGEIAVNLRREREQKLEENDATRASRSQAGVPDWGEIVSNIADVAENMVDANFQDVEEIKPEDRRRHFDKTSGTQATPKVQVAAHRDQKPIAQELDAPPTLAELARDEEHAHLSSWGRRDYRGYASKRPDIYTGLPPTLAAAYRRLHSETEYQELLDILPGIQLQRSKRLSCATGRKQRRDPDDVVQKVFRAMGFTDHVSSWTEAKRLEATQRTVSDALGDRGEEAHPGKDEFLQTGVHDEDGALMDASKRTQSASKAWVRLKYPTGAAKLPLKAQGQIFTAAVIKRRHRHLGQWHWRLLQLAMAKMQIPETEWHVRWRELANVEAGKTWAELAAKAKVAGGAGEAQPQKEKDGKERRGEAGAGEEDLTRGDKKELRAHVPEGSQRPVVFKCRMELIQKELEAVVETSAEAKTTVAHYAALTPTAFDSFLYRARAPRASEQCALAPARLAAPRPRAARGERGGAMPTGRSGGWCGGAGSSEGTSSSSSSSAADSSEDSAASSGEEGRGTEVLRGKLDRRVGNRLSLCLTNHVVRRYFRRYAALRREDGSRGLGPERIGLMGVEVAGALRVPHQIFRELPTVFERFDFDGCGMLSEVECTNMFRSVMRQKRKELQGHARENAVPVATLGERGYVVERELGRGGQGVMYKCSKVGSSDPYCVKFYDKSVDDDIDDVIEEYTLMKSLSSEYIAKTYEVFQDDLYYYRRPIFWR
ncbi:unnamed protein product [Prorocentrum cordatum]|uniref:Protein kinase domain-containing protein n=1 Tax=Prorocentrum cordatum TaxID=2364126 RepID=A0ABN9XRB5_9DINO|nr:unnamed protein product [Polarella glacialis]